jgi:hypothetical protein
MSKWIQQRPNSYCENSIYLQVQDLVDVLQIGVKNNLKFVIATGPK